MQCFTTSCSPMNHTSYIISYCLLFYSYSIPKPQTKLNPNTISTLTTTISTPLPVDMFLCNNNPNIVSLLHTRGEVL